MPNASPQPSLPSKMRALVLQAPLNMELSVVEIPTLEPGDLLIEVKAATTCGTDLKAFRRGHPQIPMPGLFGHEYSGIVAATGEGAKFSVGQAVMGVHSAPCQQCFWCVRGQENMCESIMKTMVMGSFAQYLRIPARIANLNVFEKPDHLSFEIASLLEPFACVAQGILELQKVISLGKTLPPDSKVLIIGPGAIGLLFIAGLRLSGVKHIVLAGRNKDRMAAGKSLGATPIPYADLIENNPADFDIVIECTGQVEVWEKSVDFSRRGGVVMLFGGCAAGTRARFDTRHLHYDQITLLSPFHFGTAAVRQARDWIVQPDLDLSIVISGHRSLDQAAATFEDLIASRGIKYVFQP